MVPMLLRSCRDRKGVVPHCVQHFRLAPVPAAVGVELEGALLRVSSAQAMQNKMVAAACTCFRARHRHASRQAGASALDVAKGGGLVHPRRIELRVQSSGRARGQ